MMVDISACSVLFVVDVASASGELWVNDVL